MTADHSANYERELIESTFLCERCGNPLYTSSRAAGEIHCFTPDCPNRWDNSVNRLDPSRNNQPRLYAELKALRDSIRADIVQWDGPTLIRALYDNRLQLIKAFLIHHQPLAIEHFLVLGELLLETNRGSPQGTVADPEQFALLIQRAVDLHRLENHAEDLRTQRYIPVLDSEGYSVYQLAFAESIARIHRSAGLIATSDYPSPNGLFTYAHIEGTAAVRFSDIFEDVAALLSDLLPLSITMTRALSLRWRTAQQYNYKPTSIDMSVILGWNMEIASNDVVATRPLAGLEQRLDPHFRKFSGGGQTATDFIQRYILSNELVPVAVNINGTLYMDRLTVSWFIIYLNGIIDLPRSSSQWDASIDAYRARFANLFEDWIRATLFSKGFTGPDSALVKARDGQRFEYDIIAASIGRNEVWLIEVKSGDMAPSSMTGSNLLRQELLGDGQLIDQARTQQERFEFFLANRDLFARHLPAQMRARDYHVRPFLITKTPPLISKYCNVDVQLATEFLDAVLVV